ncbi:MAG: hypothetical protein ACI396_06655 [Acutalibacteraceae bacterium]
MIIFTEKRQEFLKNMRVKIASDNAEQPHKANSILGDDADDDTMALLAKKFEELFGPIDDDD